MSFEGPLASYFVKHHSGKVRRSHTLNPLREQQVSSHCWNLLILADYITDYKASPELMRACVYHDCPEVQQGDVPATAKWHNASLDSVLTSMEEEWFKEYDIPNFVSFLSVPELALFKAIDLLEFQHFQHDEILYGNMSLANNFRKVSVHLGARVDALARVNPSWANRAMDLVTRLNTSYLILTRRIGEFMEANDA